MEYLPTKISAEQAHYFQRNCVMQVKTKTNFVFYDEKIEVKVLYIHKNTGDLQNASFKIGTVVIQDEANQQFPKTNQSGQSNFYITPESNYFVNGTSDFSIHLSKHFKPVGTKIRILVKTAIGNIPTEAKSSELLLCRGSLHLLNDVPEKWYKDEGGKSNCIPLHVKLHSKDRARFVGIDQIPLCATLLYEDQSTVPITDILHPFEGMVMPTFQTKGFTINFKVAHCSQSHQGKQFRIKISPDTKIMPELSDISPVLSKPFQVKSKRRRKSSPRESNKRAAQYNQVFPKKPKVEPVQTYPAPEIDKVGVCHPESSASDLKLILGWVGSTLSTLESLQWEHVGFSLDSKGDADKSLPIYRCPSCKKYKEHALGQPGIHTLSCQIANNLKDYTTSVRPLFLKLASKIEKLEFEASTMKKPGTNHQHHQGKEAEVAHEANQVPDDEVGKTPEITSAFQKPKPQVHSRPLMIDVDNESIVKPQKLSSLSRPSSIGRNISDMILQSSAFQRHISDMILGILPVIQEPTSLTENKVHYILAEEFKARNLRMESAPSYGNPAFDCNSHLLGFYVCHFSGNLGSPIIKFYDTTQWAILDSGAIESLQQDLSKKLSNAKGMTDQPSSRTIAVFNIADYEMDLRKMKENCFQELSQKITFQDFSDDDVLDLYSAVSKSEESAHSIDPDDNDDLCDNILFA